MCIWDGAGTDLLDLSGFSNTQSINLADGTFSNVGGLTGNLSIAIGAVIENATGSSGADIIYGNAVANILIGGLGADQLFGGAGNDTIYYDANDNLANVLGGSGTDTLYILNGSAPTSFNLASHEFESAHVRTTDLANNQSWSARSDYYNASWQLLQQDTLNDNNSTITTLFDVAGVQPWSQATTYYTASGLTTQQSCPATRQPGDRRSQHAWWRPYAGD